MAAKLSDELTVDKEFSAIGRRLTAEEENFLYLGLSTDGCLDPIIVWANHDDTILDGHNRYRLCVENDIPFKTKAIALPDREACIEWIRHTQLGRRNLTEEQKSYLRGKKYNADKKSQGGSRKSSGNGCNLKTVESVAEEFDVSPRTISNDAAFADAVDAIADNMGEQAKSEILDGKSGLSRADVQEVAEAPPDEQPRAMRRKKSSAGKGRNASAKSDCEKLVDSIEQLITRVDRMAASHLGHNSQSKLVVRSLKECIGKVKSMQKSWRNK